ncbi:MAG: hypothetical protein HOL85_10845 [Rhodospirillaceae bacterium]|nr:hypothetical protein [Rhodospirillaceae bacterium]
MSNGMIETLTQEFVDESSDRLQRIDTSIVEIESGAKKWRDISIDVHREIHSLKGMGGMFGFPAITTISHRLESYIKQSDDAGEIDWGEVHVFLDHLTTIVEKAKNPNDSAMTKILTSLPVFHSHAITASSGKRIQVLLVNHNRIIGRMVAAVLGELGCGTIISTDPFEGLREAVLGRPDLILISPTLDGLGGVDVIRALNTMNATQDIPVAVVTSFKPGHNELAGVPEGTPIISTQTGFEEGLAEVMTTLMS